MKPYTYLIGWSALNKWYYGVRYAKGCVPEDLWTTYFTSSTHVKACRMEHGEPDVVQTRRTFNSPESARRWEEQVLRRIGAVLSPKWLNLSYGGTKFVGCGGWNKGLPMSEDQRARLRSINLGKKLDESTKQKISMSQQGRKRSEEARVNIAAAQSAKKGVPRSAEVRQKMKEAWEVRRKNHPSRPHSEETKAKMRAAAIARHQSKTINHN